MAGCLQLIWAAAGMVTLANVSYWQQHGLRALAHCAGQTHIPGRVKQHCPNNPRCLQYGVNLRPLLASLGASSLVIGIAMQNLLRNVAAGVTLVWHLSPACLPTLAQRLPRCQACTRVQCPALNYACPMPPAACSTR